MNDIFSDIPEALTNTLEVLDKVEPYSIDHGPIMPFFPIPERLEQKKSGKRNSQRKTYTRSSPPMRMARILSHPKKDKRL